MSSDENEEYQPSSNDFFINWDETCVIPEPNLLTEESFNKHAQVLSYPAYYKLFNNDSTDQPQVSDKTKERECYTGPESKKQKDDLDASNRITQLTGIFENLTDTGIVTHYHVKRPPIYSKITFADRRFYKWCMKQKAIENKNENILKSKVTEFQGLLMRINKEQEEYHRHLHKCAQANIKKYLYVRDEIKELVLGYIMHNIMHTIKNFQGSYSFLQNINPMDVSMSNAESSFEFIKTVIEQRNIPTVDVPTLNKPLMTSFKPFNNNKYLSTTKVDELLHQENADVYMSSDSLILYMENMADITCEFLIPIVVKHYKKDTSEVFKRIIFGNPLPRRQINCRDVNATFYRKRLKDLMRTSTKTIDPIIETEDGSERTVNLFKCGNHQILIETEKDCKNPKTNQTFQISPKIEFQPSIGFEQLTALDFCRSWWDSMIANTDYVLHSRVDPRNDCLIKVDSYSRDVLCAPGCPYKPRSQFFLLDNLLTTISSFCEPGDYLFEHETGKNNLVLLQEKNGGVISVESKYIELLKKDRELLSETVFPWLPIDTNLVPSEILKSGDIPWLFQVTNPDAKKRGGGRDRNTARRGKQKNLNHPSRSSEFKPNFIKLGRPKRQENVHNAELDFF